MRIVLDMQGAQTESRFRGIGRYSIALAQAIVRNAEEHDVWIVVNNRLPEAVDSVRHAFADILPPERVVAFDVPAGLSWERESNTWRRRASELIREDFLSELQPDIVHISSLFEGANLCDATHSIGTLDADVKVAVTLYDLIPLLDPDNYLGADWVRQWYMDRVENLKRADLLLSISEYSRQEAIDTLSIDAGRIVNISSAHTADFRPVNEDLESREKLLSRYGIDKPYVMYNGALETRKNLDRLLEAFSLLPEKLRESHQLVFVGKISEIDRVRLTDLAISLSISERFVLTGYVSDSDLAGLFTYCSLFVFPSLHEGFGLPALEAMACGAATVGSNVTSIPEVIGRSDALFDPTKSENIASKIAEALEDENFLFSLRKHAIVQASKFSWDLCAKRALAAFEQKKNNSAAASKFVKWSEVSAWREQRYRKLIEAIALIPRDGVPSDTDLLEVARCIAVNRSKTELILRAQQLLDKITWRIEGPFDSSYSLALVNRETARALDALGHHVVLHSTEGPGDFTANPEFLGANSDIAKLHARCSEISALDAEVTSRNLYPPRVADMGSRINLLHHYAWEESGFPAEWVESFNEKLQGITCLSSHVKKVLEDNGVTVPLSVSGCGVDHWLRVAVDENYRINAKSFRFLHVSSCFPRKGADILLKAYGASFSSLDDVTLVIKTFPNPHNEVHRWLEQARSENKNFPDVLIIEEDLTDGQLKALYEQCHVLVAPSRAEGFGLPLAEAMLSGLAVITTGWSGQLDFCNERTAWLVDYQFVSADSHFGLFDSVWAEPDLDHLSVIIREVYELSPISRGERVAAGKQLLLEKFKWIDVAERLVSSARSWAELSARRPPRIGWITSWNTRCGIATYSAHLIENLPSEVTILGAHAAESMPDGPEVVRCWAAGGSDSLDELAKCIEELRIDTLVVQFNYSFFDLEYFGRFLDCQIGSGRRVIVTLHSTVDPVHIQPNKRLEVIRDSLARCCRILVHSVGDLNRLKALKLIDNVCLFPHGIRDWQSEKRLNFNLPLPASRNEFTVASYGFFLPHKGLLELVEAVALLCQRNVNVRLIMANAEYPVPESAELIHKVKEKVRALGVRERVEIITKFLPDEESLAILSMADVIVFPYQNTGESASGAVRYGLSVGKPVLVTPLPIFDDVDPVVFKLPGFSPDDIARGIEKALTGGGDGLDGLQEKLDVAQKWRAAHSFSYIGRRLHGMLASF